MTDGSEVLGGTLLDSNGDVTIERIAISRFTPADINSNIVVASNGTGFLAAWARWTGSEHQVVLARFRGPASSAPSVRPESRARCR